MKINISIDFEGEEHYFRTLGVPYAGKLTKDFYRSCAARFLEMFDRMDIKATFFIIGKDVDENRDVLRDILAAGHQIGNHSYGHPFGMSTHHEQDQHDDILKAHETIKEALGVEPRCYRAPCYDISYANIKFLKSLGYTCDSSFYVSKLAFFQKLVYKLYTNRPVFMGPWDVHVAPRTPFFVSFENGKRSISRSRDGKSLLEVPIPCFTFLEFPLYSTPQFVFGKNFVKWGIKSLIGKKIPFTYELHSLDVSCAQRDGLDKTLKKLPQLKVDFKKRMKDFEEIFTIFKNEADIVPITELL